MCVDFVGDGGGVAPHELVAQRLVVQHLPTPFGRGVEDHALSEDRRHEGIRLGLVEDLLRRTEEELVGLGPGEQHDVAVGQAKLSHVTAFGPHPLKSPMGSSRSSSRCPCGAGPSRDHGAVRAVRRWRSCGPLLWSGTGASGLTSIMGKCVPGGVATAVNTAAATAVGGAGSGCGGLPHRTHSPRTSAVMSGPSRMPISVRVWPGWTIVPAPRFPRAPSAARGRIPRAPIWTPCRRP